MKKLLYAILGIGLVIALIVFCAVSGATHVELTILTSAFLLTFILVCISYRLDKELGKEVK